MMQARNVFDDNRTDESWTERPTRLIHKQLAFLDSSVRLVSRRASRVTVFRCTLHGQQALGSARGTRKGPRGLRPAGLPPLKWCVQRRGSPCHQRAKAHRAHASRSRCTRRWAT